MDGRDAGAKGTFGTGAARPMGGLVAVPARAGFFFIMAACFAAISARFWAMSSAAESCNPSVWWFLDWGT